MKNMFKFIFVSIVALVSTSVWSLEITADEVRSHAGSESRLYSGNVRVLLPENSDFETTSLTVKTLSSGEQIFEGGVTIKFKDLILKTEKVVISSTEGGLMASMDRAEVTGK
ncbi:hypothetical protein Mag101_08400 [Microbulbifer agarilyticus]|uniref:Organic solvent tolerance-like N-terminal domain-containing protein n=1 Tax=Microbulbifer agarilyticus TaxID=260552 RepID=A0A1Q2M4J4_9GAMM|nr:hypothetical protein [Microbulbifer agarilyticus]AQQ67655.1 hypothetical protein Mag101_08400 [Microbulbifer agarilyticus]